MCCENFKKIVGKLLEKLAKGPGNDIVITYDKNNCGLIPVVYYGRTERMTGYPVAHWSTSHLN